MLFITYITAIFIELATMIAMIMSEVGKIVLPIVFSGLKTMFTFMFKKRR